MEPPFTSFQLKIALEVGLQLIHPDFCKWLWTIHEWPCWLISSCIGWCLQPLICILMPI